MSKIQFKNVSFSYIPKSERKRMESAGLNMQDSELQDSALQDSELQDSALQDAHKWGTSPSVLWALSNISFTIDEGEFIGLAGHTGSGKSTLIQLVAGLLQPTSGQVIIDNQDIATKQGASVVRSNVGVVFQHPENQLFAQSVYDDVAFGPRNLGLSDEEVQSRVEHALSIVGLTRADVGEKSPFALSGGQQRRVAIAGVLAMKPKVLVLDEPSSGLDPRAHDAMFELFSKLHTNQEMTIILASHNMNDIAAMCTRALILNKGSLYGFGTPSEIFACEERLHAIGLEEPNILRFANKLGLGNFSKVPTIDELASLIAKRKIT